MMHGKSASRFATAVAASVMLFFGCSARQGELDRAAELIARRDSAMFAALLLHIQENDTIPEIRADPRPLRTDPDLVTFHDFSVAADLVSPEAQRNPLADVDLSITKVRKQLLRAFGIRETDAFRDSQCPGGLAPPTDAIVASPHAVQESYCITSKTGRSILARQCRRAC